MEDNLIGFPVRDAREALKMTYDGQSGEESSGAHEITSTVTPKPNGGTFEPSLPVRPSQSPPELDPFDPRNHKKAQDPRLNPGANVSAAVLPAAIYVGKPKKSWFIRFHPDAAYRVVLPLFTDDDSKRRDSNTYLFAPSMEVPPDLEGLVTDTLVAAAITDAGVPFLYKLNVNDSSWYESGLAVIQRGMEEWIRVKSADGCYETSPPIARLDEPHFPDAPLRDWLDRAFAKRVFKSLDDPRVKKLRGAR